MSNAPKVDYALLRASALPQRCPTFGVSCRFAPLLPYVGARPKYSHPLASKLAWARYFWRCNHVMIKDTTDGQKETAEGSAPLYSEKKADPQTKEE